MISLSLLFHYNRPAGIKATLRTLQSSVGGTVPRVPGDYGCVLWMAHNTIAQMLYVVQMKMIIGMFVLGVRNYCLLQPLLSVTPSGKKNPHHKTNQQKDLHSNLSMSPSFKKDSSLNNGIAIATRSFFFRQLENW